MRSRWYLIGPREGRVRNVGAVYVRELVLALYLRFLTLLPADYG